MVNGFLPYQMTWGYRHHAVEKYHGTILGKLSTIKLPKADLNFVLKLTWSILVYWFIGLQLLLNKDQYVKRPDWWEHS